MAVISLNNSCDLKRLRLRLRWANILYTFFLQIKSKLKNLVARRIQKTIQIHLFIVLGNHKLNLKQRVTHMKSEHFIKNQLQKISNLSRIVKQPENI